MYVLREGPVDQCLTAYDDPAPPDDADQENPVCKRGWIHECVGSVDFSHTVSFPVGVTVDTAGMRRL